MVQVLPYVPSFGEQLIPTLVQAGSEIAQNIQRRNAETALQKFLNPHGIPSENLSALDQVTQQAQHPGSHEINANQALAIHDLATKARGPEAARALVNTYLEQQKLASKEAIQSRKEDTEAFKITQDYREKLLDAYEGAKRTETQLSRLKELNDQDKLTTPAIAKIADSFGIPLSILANPESEEFQKLSQDLMSNITKYYGNRILQVEVDNFLKTIPTLMNSKEGRDRVIENMKLLQEPARLSYEAYKDIRKNGGRIPLDLHERVLEKIDPQLDKLAEKFKQGTDDVTAPKTSKEAEGFAVVTAPDGSQHWIPKSKVAEALKAGGKLQ